MRERSGAAGRRSGRPEGGAAHVDGAAESEELVALAAAAATGSPEALESLYDHYHPLLAGVIAALVRRRPDGVERADLEQETAESFCELVHSFDPARRVNLTTYLQKALRWRVANYLRAEARRSAHLPLEAAPLDELADRVAVSPVPPPASPRLARALGRLSPRQRMVIAGFYWRDRTAGELAGELGVTPQAVTGLRRRAESRLRKELEGDEPHPLTPSP